MTAGPCGSGLPAAIGRRSGLPTACGSGLPAAIGRRSGLPTTCGSGLPAAMISRSSLPTAARLLLLTSLTLATAACGFHLRTLNIGTTITSAYVQSNPRNPLERPLEQSLRQVGVKQAESAEQAEVVVQLLDSREERRNAAVSGEARVTEYEVSRGVLYRITDGNGHELVPAQWVERQRVYRVDQNNIVGSSEEQSLLEREMQQDLVQQILRTLDSAVAGKSGAG